MALSESQTLLQLSCPIGSDLSPAQIFEKLGLKNNCILLQGSAGGWFDGAESLIGFKPFARFQSNNKTSSFEDLTKNPSQTTFKSEAPLEHLETWLQTFDFASQTKPPPGNKTSSAFHGGGVLGYFGYDLIHRYEKISLHPGSKTLPDICLLFFNAYIRLDHHRHRAEIYYNPEPLIRLGGDKDDILRKGKRTLEQLSHLLQEPSQKSKSPTKKDPGSEIQLQCDWTEKTYKESVTTIKKHITAGDIFQANLSRRFSLSAKNIDLFSTYLKLWEINPSPFACYLHFGEIEIASASPELLFRIRHDSEGRRIETRPIAGTKPRSHNPVEDEAYAKSLHASRKERAEHLMLVDLERNDLGKVCDYGTVSVEELMVLERYSHVMHLVSHIGGRLRTNVGPLEALRALFPGGTITGVPKIRCMEILSQLEKSPRGLYTGAIGYIGFNGTAELNIAIRTLVREKEEISFQTGGGIVADSNPQHEYQETRHKAAAMMEALGIDPTIQFIYESQDKQQERED